MVAICPKMVDALWSVLVKAGVLADDGLIREVVWREHPLDRKAPMVRITLTKLNSAAAIGGK